MASFQPRSLGDLGGTVERPTIRVAECSAFPQTTRTAYIFRYGDLAAFIAIFL